MNTRIFWSRVRSRIKENGRTQLEMARAGRIPYSTLRNWMSRNINPPLMYAHRISRYLQVSLEYLVSGQGIDYVSKTNEEVLTLIKRAEEKLSNIRNFPS